VDSRLRGNDRRGWDAGITGWDAGITGWDAGITGWDVEIAGWETGNIRGTRVTAYILQYVIPAKAGIHTVLVHFDIV